MSELEQKLGTLSNGAEAVAAVMKNWEGVLGVIGMVGGEAFKISEGRESGKGEKEGQDQGQAQGQDLPVTLVRIPVEGAKREGEEAG